MVDALTMFTHALPQALRALKPVRAMAMATYCFPAWCAHLLRSMQTSALAFYSVVASALLAVVWLLAQPLWQRWRWRRLRSAVFPSEWRKILRRCVPFVARLPADLQLRLKQDMLVFLADKPFMGCAGLQVTDVMRVTVAALACLPLLGARRAYYPQLQRILLYPGAFAVQHAQRGEDGVQSEGVRALVGQSWAQGQVLLAWDEVQEGAADPTDGRNVVIHEFAHQLDQAKGFANGAPSLRTRQAYRSWSAVMQAEFDALRQRLSRDEDGLIEAYAATDPAEFFAVCSELFFERAPDLAAQHPQLFQQLRAYYRINPLSWS
jgi:Mlc titration factor MtfA (ptsG expression regulator)